MKQNIFLALVSIFMIQSSLLAQDNPLWMRYPSISPDGEHIVFTYKGDLYLVGSNGGDAKQITFHEAHDYMPVWSSDSKKIAFASDRYGNFDVFIMDAAGGAADRLTYHSNDEEPYSFSNGDSLVIFGGQRQDLASHRQFPTGYMPEVYTVPASGGGVNQMWTIPAEYLQFNAIGNKIIYHDKKGGENEWRKHHQSSVARDLWLYDQESDTHKQLTKFYGEDRQPIFSSDEQSIYFLSETSGTFNIFKMPIDKETEKVQLTQFDLHPVRFLSRANNGMLSFGYDGSLYTMLEGQAPQKLELTIKTQGITNKDQFITINGGVQEMSIAPNGKEIAFISRGEVFVTSVDGKITKRVTNTPAQEKFIEFAPDGKSIYYAREENGKFGIFKSKKLMADEPFFFASTLLNEEKVLDNGQENYLPDLSPDGKKLAYIENRKTLKVYDLDTKTSVTLLTSADLFHMSDGDQYFNWSPDSKWLLATYRPTMPNAEVLLLDASGQKEKINLTESGYGDYNPKWVNDGKQMLWFSNRDGLKSFATSGGSQLDVYSMFFTQATWDKFNLSEDDFKLLEAIEANSKKDEDKEEDKKSDKKDKKKEPKEEVTALSFDWSGLRERKAKFTIHSSDLSDAVLSKKADKLYYLSSFEKGLDLWSTDLRTQETKKVLPLGAKRGSLTWSTDHETLFLLSDGSISKLDVEAWKSEPIKINGEMTLDKDAEQAYMFEHVWIRTKGIFYTPSMHGIDWDQMKTEYGKYIPHIGNGYEFSEMLSEMLGELNVSHAGSGYNRPVEGADATASIGIFMDRDFTGNGIKIKEIITEGPLDKAKFTIPVGSIIEKIDGQQVSNNVDLAQYFNRRAGDFMLLEIYNPKTKGRQQITVKPISLAEERRLLYKRWVRINEKEVTEKSKGQLGYVHIPSMSDGPYRNTYEEMMGKFHDRKGAIVDTRFNGGGDLVADLAMFFTGEKFLSYATAEREVGYEPTFRWIKPTLAMFNEANYSDGHCFSCGYSELNIGKTVGMPVPGTCSFAGWEGLPNGGYWGVVPVSAKNQAGEWLENNESVPDFQVKNKPSSIVKGIDEQLEKAIEELLKDVK